MITQMRIQLLGMFCRGGSERWNLAQHATNCSCMQMIIIVVDLLLLLKPDPSKRLNHNLACYPKYHVVKSKLH